MTALIKEHLTGASLQFQKFSPLLSEQESMAAYRQTFAGEGTESSMFLSIGTQQDCATQGRVWAYKTSKPSSQWHTSSNKVILLSIRPHYLWAKDLNTWVSGSHSFTLCLSKATLGLSSEMHFVSFKIPRSLLQSQHYLKVQSPKSLLRFTKYLTCEYPCEFKMKSRSYTCYKEWHIIYITVPKKK